MDYHIQMLWPNYEELQFSKGTRGKIVATNKGYAFHIHRKHNGNVSWQCNQRKKYKCRVNLHTFNNRIFKQTGAHNHSPVMPYE